MISSEGEERGREEIEKAGEWMKTRARNTSRHGHARAGRGWKERISFAGLGSFAIHFVPCPASNYDEAFWSMSNLLAKNVFVSRQAIFFPRSLTCRGRKDRPIA